MNWRSHLAVAPLWVPFVVIFGVGCLVLLPFWAATADRPLFFTLLTAWFVVVAVVGRQRDTIVFASLWIILTVRLGREGA